MPGHPRGSAGSWGQPPQLLPVLLDCHPTAQGVDHTRGVGAARRPGWRSGSHGPTSAPFPAPPLPSPPHHRPSPLHHHPLPCTTPCPAPPPPTPHHHPLPCATSSLPPYHHLSPLHHHPLPCTTTFPYSHLFLRCLLSLSTPLPHIGLCPGSQQPPAGPGTVKKQETLHGGDGALLMEPLRLCSPSPGPLGRGPHILGLDVRAAEAPRKKRPGPDQRLPSPSQPPTLSPSHRTTTPVVLGFLRSHLRKGDGPALAGQDQPPAVAS